VLCLYLLLPQRQEYDDFLVDRLRTVKCLRASEGDDRALDPKQDSLRGLEPFQTAIKHKELHNKRQFHQTTIILEQTRQSRLSICDPERFRLLVAPRSELALRRAQELAALDEHEVYRRVCRRSSLLMSRPSILPKTCASATHAVELSLGDRIRTLQEWHEKRLAEIYQNSNNAGGFSSRFAIRRDSLFGTVTPGGGGGVGGSFVPTARFSPEFVMKPSLPH
jgi:hypothetical protein